MTLVRDLNEDQYHADTGRYPDSLEQLVEKKYLARLPLDPILESDSGWIIEPPEEGMAPGAVRWLRDHLPDR